MYSNIHYYKSIYDKIIIMATDNKQKLFDVMGKLNPDFKQPNKENLQEQYATAGTPANIQPNAQLPNSIYKTVAPALKQVNTLDKFAPAFKDWFSFLGYSPKEGNINILKVRTDVENIMKSLGYK